MEEETKSITRSSNLHSLALKNFQFLIPARLILALIVLCASAFFGWRSPSVLPFTTTFQGHNYSVQQGLTVLKYSLVSGRSKCPSINSNQTYSGSEYPVCFCLFCCWTPSVLPFTTTCSISLITIFVCERQQQLSFQIHPWWSLTKSVRPVEPGEGGRGHCVFKWILPGHFKPMPIATIWIMFLVIPIKCW